MEITDKEIENLRIELEEQQRINIELSQKENEYRIRTRKNDLDLTIIWQDNISEVDKEFLKSKINIPGLDNFEENFTVVNLNLSNILNYHCESVESANSIFPITQLWDTCRNDRLITKLILHIEEGKTVCPPVIDFTFVELTKTEVFVIYDGNHRIGLSRFLGLESIPFIIRKNNLDRIQSI